MSLLRHRGDVGFMTAARDRQQRLKRSLIPPAKNPRSRNWVVFRFLPPEASLVVEHAQRCGLPGSQPAPGYLSPDLCTAVSLLLAVPSLGYSLLLVPLVWVAQYEHTDRRIERLRCQLKQRDENRPGASSLRGAIACGSENRSVLP
ncbi:MAG: hypothetical protein ACKO6F_09985 [Cyanobium sp.]